MVKSGRTWTQKISWIIFWVKEYLYKSFVIPIWILIKIHDFMYPIHSNISLKGRFLPSMNKCNEFHYMSSYSNFEDFYWDPFHIFANNTITYDYLSLRCGCKDNLLMRFFHTPDKAEDSFSGCKKKKHNEQAKIIGRLIRIWIDTGYAGMTLEEFIRDTMGSSKHKPSWFV